MSKIASQEKANQSKATVIHARHEESDQRGSSTWNPDGEDVNETNVMEGVMQKVMPMIEAGVKRAIQGAARADRRKPKYQRRQHFFKNKGNQKRYEANEDVLEKFEDASDAIGSRDIAAAQEAINAGKQIVLKQQKLIKMADREELGWDVVRYYASDDLASDSDDEKAINRARREALATMKKRNADKQKGKEDTFRNAYKSTGGNGDRTSSTYSNSSSYTRGGTICYFCGKEGHMQWACPSRYSRR